MFWQACDLLPMTLSTVWDNVCTCYEKPGVCSAAFWQESFRRMMLERQSSICSPT